METLISLKILQGEEEKESDSENEKDLDSEPEGWYTYLMYPRAFVAER